MPSVDVGQPPEEERKLPPKIGIIYPPPEVRNIVDKTASFVARNGPEFESRIRQNEINNPKFNFLNPADPYYAYYQQKVSDFAEGKATESSVLKPTAPSAARLIQDTPKAIAESFVPKDPPADFEFTSDPPSIHAQDLDVVKLTAQFVARNGRQFLTQLMNREQRNYQFDFLRPQHSLFTYFTKLVEQYTKILIPPKDLVSKLEKEAEATASVLSQVQYRVDWQRYQERQRKKEEEAAERERVAYAQIDWHDFVVVETVDFQPHEAGNFPPPTTPDEVGARVLAEERGDKPRPPPVRRTHEVDLDMSSDEEDQQRKEEGEDMEQSDEESSESDMEEAEKSKEEAPPPPPPGSPPPPPPPAEKTPAPPTQIPLPPTMDSALIRRDYNPKASAPQGPSADEVLLVSPFTGERISAKAAPKHVRVGLLDPKWIEQRDRDNRDKRDGDQVFAPGMVVEASLKLLAERRTDIFGVGADEAAIGKKLGEESIKEPSGRADLIWDGHSGTGDTVAKRVRENVTADEQAERVEQQRRLEEEREKIGIQLPTSSAAGQPPQPPPQAPPPQRPPAAPPVHQAPIMATQHMIRPPTHPPPMAMGPPPGRPTMMMMPPPQQTLVARPAVAPMLAPMAFLTQAPQQMAPPPGPPGDFDEPPFKKQRTEENLIPEELFMRTNKSPVQFRVVIPEHLDKPEWKLNGQVLNFTLPLTETMATVKSLICDHVGIPAAKQKLSLDGLFLRDNNNLAFYNITPGMPIHLQTKERGGRSRK